MSPYHLVLLPILLVPLALDVFVLSAALGVAGLPREQQGRASLTLAVFEAGMPVAGVLAGRALGTALGHLAVYFAAAAIGLAGLLLFRSGNEDEEERGRVRLLARARGLAVIGLGIGISLDELALGLGLGLLGVPLGAAVIYLGIQSFAAARLGLWLGGRVSERLRERGERAAGAVLVAAGILLIIVTAAGQQW